MDYKNLGHTDIKVSTISLGTMTWGEQNNEVEAFEQMDMAVDYGVNFFDTAELYPIPPSANTRGDTSRIIGRWLKNKKNRSKIILADKVVGRARMDWFRDNNELPRLSKKQLIYALERSLKDLNTDYIDLYQLHWPDRPINAFDGLEYEHREEQDIIPIEETLEQLNKFVKEGKIRSFGLSNETPWGMMHFINHSKNKGYEKIVSIQNCYNILNRSYEVGLSEISIRENVGLLAYSPLGSGVISGKYLNNQMPKGSRLKLFGERYPRYQTINTDSAVKAYIEIAKKYNLDVCQMAIKFCEIQKFTTSVIIGATNKNQLETNLKSHEEKLTEEIINDINQVQLIYSNPCP